MACNLDSHTVSVVLFMQPEYHNGTPMQYRLKYTEAAQNETEQLRVLALVHDLGLFSTPTWWLMAVCNCSSR